MITNIKDSFLEASKTLEKFLSNENNLNKIDDFVNVLVSAFRNGKKVMSCGNGGSMCDAMHFAEEWTGRFRKDRKPLPAISLSDASHISCTSNDYGFEYIFSRMVESLGQSGDVFLGISTSGNSPNVINATEVALSKNIYTVCLLGRDGGKLKSMCDLPIIVPASSSDRVQEVHIKILHITIECVERILFPEHY